MRVQSQSSFHQYFSANDTLDRGWLKNGILAALRTDLRTSGGQRDGRAQVQERNFDAVADKEIEIGMVENSPEVLVQGASQEVRPHRRRWQQRKVADTAAEEQLPLDASSRLTTAASALPASATWRRTFTTYLSLSKPRLSFLILLTTTSAYSLYPIPDLLSSTTAAIESAGTTTLSTSTLTLLFLTSGTFLSCASANAFNMLFEPKYDALMARTRNRPLVRGLISSRGALVFAILTGVSGLALLDFGTNSTVTALSGINIFLYGFVYTPLKRISPLNTWIGAIVGGIPPLMGWAAAQGQYATSEHHSWRDLLFSEQSVGGWLLAGLLFAWQFPHFNSLSHTIREDYKNAGHKMLAWMNPARNARVALRYSVLMFPICAGMYYYDLVNPGFLVISTACNLWMTREAIRFWKHQGAQGSARGLFWASVWQLPLVLVAALVCKTGIWDGFLGDRGKNELSIYEDADLETLQDEEVPLGMESPLQSKAMHGAYHNMGFKRPS